MNGNFERCLKFVLDHEGGWSDDPHDPHPPSRPRKKTPQIVKMRLPSKSHFKARTAHLASFGYPTTLKVIFTICPLFVPNNKIIV